MNKKQRSFVHETTFFPRMRNLRILRGPPSTGEVSCVSVSYPRPKAPELAQEDPERFFFGNQHPFLVIIKNGVLTYPLSQ